MSRNLSLKKIVPHLRSYAITRNDQTIPPSFDKHFIHKRKRSSDEENSDSRERNKGPFTESGKSESHGLPEMFQLIENPDFYDLFDLSMGKKESILRLLIRKLRQERGASEYLTVSTKNEIYRKAIDGYYQHGSSSFVLSM